MISQMRSRILCTSSVDVSIKNTLTKYVLISSSIRDDSNDGIRFVVIAIR